MDEAERESKQGYIANLMWMILKCASLGGSEYPSPDAIFPPIIRREEKSSEQIIADVLDFFEEGEEDNGDDAI